MMTVREAMQRMNQHRATMRRTGEGNEVRVVLHEWTRKEADDKAYYTDDLEDAVLTAGSMRREHDMHVWHTLGQVVSHAC